MISSQALRHLNREVEISLRFDISTEVGYSLDAGRFQLPAQRGDSIKFYLGKKIVGQGEFNLPNLQRPEIINHLVECHTAISVGADAKFKARFAWCTRRRVAKADHSGSYGRQEVPSIDHSHL